jgi:hypothetical protein
MPTFVKQILKPGTYTVAGRQEFISPERIAKWVANFAKMQVNGLKIPAPWRHDPKAQPVRNQMDQQDTNAYQNGGFWRELWIDETDGSLHGAVEVPLSDDAKKVGTTVKEVSPLIQSKWTDGNGSTYDDAITHIALVTHPVAPGQTNFEGIALSQGAFVDAADLTLAHEEPDGDECDPKNVKATGATIAKALPILAKLGLGLPSDTDESNFAERIIVAALAIESHAAHDKEDEEENAEEPPKKSKEKPSPIAMSHELTPAQQAQLAFAQQTLRERYAARVEALVQSGRVSAKYALEKLKPLLETHEVAFAADGKPIDGPLDLILGSLESLPASSALTGSSPAKLKKGVSFSLDSASIAAFAQGEQSLPDDMDELSGDFDIDKVIDAQFAAAGLR